MGLTGNCGCEFVAVEATMSSGPAFRSVFVTSGAAASLTALCCIRGATAVGLIRSRGFGAGEVAAHSAMLGICGTMVGGAAGALGWINVWRGCVMRTGCERMVWRG